MLTQVANWKFLINHFLFLRLLASLLAQLKPAAAGETGSNPPLYRIFLNKLCVIQTTLSEDIFSALPLLRPHAEAQQTNGVAKLQKIYKQTKYEMNRPHRRLERQT